ncbi:hypothetical protein [Chamaesiphon sp. OTE_75_metabat_556]|jgi:hypothetical protein|uniref:hypothetical protein n=1 Tax=Chamaesiphon sp. OTE_75_metabat_556 TaxID=2964692 RepID=UPI00286AC2D7|nr:hypothetical protein [Chamaesiphon sp. OTE_75_metabat_556]
MAYNNFTLESVKDRFDLQLVNNRFCELFPVSEPQSEFLTIFDESFSLAEVAKSEKAKSELLVSPILVQARRLVDRQVQLFSGEEFNVDQEKGLNGFCDFLFSKSENQFTIDAPVLMLVEAKRGEIESGLGQCVAEMVAAQSYNQLKNRSILVIYGCVTSGTLWQFLKLEDSNVTIDPTNYLVTPVQKILGILKWILSQ